MCAMLRLISKRRLRALLAAESKADAYRTGMRSAKIAENAAYIKLAQTQHAYIAARDRITQLQRALRDTERPISQWETRGGKPDATA